MVVAVVLDILVKVDLVDLVVEVLIKDLVTLMVVLLKLMPVELVVQVINPEILVQEAAVVEPGQLESPFILAILSQVEQVEMVE